MDLHVAGRHTCTHVQKQQHFLGSSSLGYDHTTQRAFPLHAGVNSAIPQSQASSLPLLQPSSRLSWRASLPRSCLVARTSSSWNAWGSDSEDAEEDLLAELAAQSQQAAAAAAARTSSTGSPTLHQPFGPISSFDASTPASSTGTSQLSRPPASSYTNLLLPGSPSSSPMAPSLPSVPGLQPLLKPQLDAARQRGRQGMPKPLMFPKADPLIDAAYKGTQCSAYYMATGEKYPRVLKDFNSLSHRPFSFPKRLQENMLAARIRVPTPIQKRAMPAIARGNDVLATAPTGTGKTAAFLLPLIGTLLRMHSREGLPRNKAYPAMVVLVPTHELVMQVHEECAALCRATHLRVVALHGGQPIVGEVMAMRKGYSGGGTDIVVATPGRLLDHVERRGSIRLERLAHIVVDEADKLLDLGFEPELRRLMSHLQMPPRDMRQMVLFCASLPQEVRELASKLLKSNGIHITAGLGSGVASLVSQHIVPVEVQHAHWNQHQRQQPTLQDPRSGTEEEGQPGHFPAASSTSSTMASTSTNNVSSINHSTEEVQHAGPKAMPSPTVPREGDAIWATKSVSTSTSSPGSIKSSTEELQPAGPRAMSASTITQGADAIWAIKLNHLAHHVSSNSSNRGLTLVFTNTIPQAAKVYSSLAELGHSVSLLHSGLSQASRDETIQCFRYGLTPIMVATSIAARGLDVPDITHVINFDMPHDIHEYVYRIGRTGRAGRPGTSTTYLALPQDRTMAQDLVAVMQSVQQLPPPWLAALAQKQQQQGGGRARMPGVRVGGGQQAAEEDSAQVRKWELGQDTQQGQRQEQHPPQWSPATLAGEGQQGGLPRQHTETNSVQALSGSPQGQQVLADSVRPANSGDPRSQKAQADSGSLLSLLGHSSLQSHNDSHDKSQDESQGEAHVRSSKLPSNSALVMESGDWSDAAIDVASLLHGSAPTASTSSSSSEPFHTPNSDAGSSSSSSSSSDASTEKGGPTNAAAAAALELSKRKKQSGVFNQYVATWWGAVPSLAPMLNSRQQYLLHRQIQWRQQHSHQAWQQQQQQQQEQEQEQQQHSLGRGGGSSSAASGGGGRASEFDGGGGADELSDQQLLRQWSEVVTKGMARLPGARMREHLIKRGTLQAKKSRLEKGELRSMGDKPRLSWQERRVKRTE